MTVEKDYERDLGLLTIVEATDKTKLGRSSLYNLVDRGELVRVRIGHRAYITRESLDAFLRRIIDKGQAEAKVAKSEQGAGTS
jgi:excisionase family DNA binding protein